MFVKELSNNRVRLVAAYGKKKERAYAMLAEALRRGGMRAAFKLCREAAELAPIRRSGYGEVANLTVAIATKCKCRDIMLEPKIVEPKSINLPPGPYDVAFLIGGGVIALIEVKLRRKGESVPAFDQMDSIYGEEAPKLIASRLVRDHGLLPFGVLIDLAKARTFRVPPYVVHIAGLSRSREDLEKIARRICEFIAECERRRIIRSSSSRS